MAYLSNWLIAVFIILFLGFFTLAGCLFKYLYERRLQAQLQTELNSLLYEYVSMDENDVETISFFNSATLMNESKTTKSDKSSSKKSGGINLKDLKAASRV
mmetsp:Transcript_25328/g.27668  ORF Transcript_25328/g.27668 Transcript_25328/m.27668 type:complete len:101 (+) Transcript_25328:131-433(+)